VRCRKSTSRAVRRRFRQAAGRRGPGPLGRAHPVELRSAFVFIEERAKASVPPLAGIREAVQREWLNARRIEAEQKLYRTLRDRYQIVVETLPKATASEIAR
jgi:hypothetical protein